MIRYIDTNADAEEHTWENTLRAIETTLTKLWFVRCLKKNLGMHGGTLDSIKIHLTDSY